MFAVLIDFQEYITTVTDPAHILTEATYAAVEIFILRKLWNRWIKRHDKDVHHHE